MRFNLEGLDVFFPYDFLYKEQYDYMLSLKRAIDSKGHALLEMPTGTGKTVCLISLITSYQFQYPATGKLIYCTRTVPEMTKCMEEIKRVIDYRKQLLGEAVGGKVLALCLSSRRNMCIHPRVIDEGDRETVDSLCRSMTASWVRAKAGQDGNNNSTSNNGGGQSGGCEVELCNFYENYYRNGSNAEIPRGVYSLDDLKELGVQKGWCPYFLTRYLINHANILVYNYQYMLDPKVSNLISRELEAESIVVFDEAHNIDNVCIEALSVILDKRAIDASVRSVNRLAVKVADLKAQDSAKLRREYEDLVRGLREAQAARTGAAAAHTQPSSSSSSSAAPNGGESAPQHRTQELADNWTAAPLLSSDILEEAVPGNIRKAEHFVSFLKKVVLYIKTLFGGQDVENKTPLAFLHGLLGSTGLERKALRFTYTRLNSLLRTLEIASLDDYTPLQEVANFATLVATYMEGFAVIIEPQGSIVSGVSEPLVQLSCLDSSIAIKPVLERFQSVIITSGTLSPIDLYPKLLNFQPVVRMSLPMSVFRPCLLPTIVTRGNDQIAISTRFEMRKDDAVIRNYGQLLIDVCASVPDGVCAFFTSYQYMEYVVERWERMGILAKVLEHKLLFLETKDVVETTLALDNFRRACDAGRGAVFLSIARGKVAEGIDFDRHYGRAVLLIGIPYQYTLSQVLKARLNFMREKYQIRDNDFLTFDALRQAAQCVGRVIRSKTDYGIVILADSRYQRSDKRNKFPPWVLQFLRESSLNLSSDVAIEQMKQFLRQMGQPIEQDALRTILYSEEQVQAWARRDFLLQQPVPSSAVLAPMDVEEDARSMDSSPSPPPPPPPDDEEEAVEMDIMGEVDGGSSHSPPPPPPPSHVEVEKITTTITASSANGSFGQTLFLFEDILDN
eukprot:gene2251-2465_t